MQKLSKILSICLAMVLVLGMATVVFAADPEGSEENPVLVTDGGFGYEMSHVFEEDGTYWFTFVPEDGGLLNITTIDVYDVDAEQVTVTAYNKTSNVYIEITNQKSSAPFTVWAEDIVLIGITAPKGADVFVCAVINTYDEYLGGYYAQINDYTFMAYVNPGETITFAAPMAMGPGSTNWGGMGLKVEGIFDPTAMFDPDPIPETTVTVNGTEFKDLKNDSNIQLTMPMSMMGSPEFSISYGNAMGYATYKITFVNEALTECDHTSKTSVSATAPDCHVDGVLAHELCDDCGSCFINGEMVDSVVDPAPYQLEYVSATVTCTQAGDIAHNHCPNCGNNYDDEGNLLESIASDALGHEMEGHEEMAPTCCAEGNYEWYWCNNCYCYFKDAEGNEEYADYADIWLAAEPEAHTWVLAESVDGEELEGNVPAEHTTTELVYICSCPNCWMIDMKDITTTLETAPSCGELEYHEATEATFDAPGNVAYYSCANCDKLFSDAEGKTEVTEEDVIIPQLVSESSDEESSESSDEESSVEESTEDNSSETDTPDTGDSTAMFYVILMAVAAIGCVVFARKKQSC